MYIPFQSSVLALTIPYPAGRSQVSYDYLTEIPPRGKIHEKNQLEQVRPAGTPNPTVPI